MQARRTLLVLSLLAAGCSGEPVSPTGAPAASAVQPTAAAPPTAVTVTEAPTATVAPVSDLEGTWTTGVTTCEQQQTAAYAAGFTADQLEAGGWDPATCGGLIHGSEFQIRFSGERLVVFQDGSVGWDGTFQVVDTDTFQAGDAIASFTYEYSIDDDELVIDMVRDDFPGASPEELMGEQLAQTVIYETAKFTRVS